MLEVRQAKYFIAVAEELHFGRAAQRLNMSQPPLSQAILQLENQLGASLLRRTSRKVQLTDAGRLFLDECRILIRASERAQAVASMASSGVVGTLRIGAVTSVYNHLLPKIFEKFRALWPDVELRTQEIDTHHGREALLRNEIDLALIRQSAGDQQIVSLPLSQDRLVLALPELHPDAASREPARLADFRDHSWVWLNRHISPDYHDELISACHQAGFRPEPMHYANSIYSQLAMVSCGLGITLVPASSMLLHNISVSFRELSVRSDLVELSLLRRSGDPEPLVEQFVQCAMSLPS